MARPSAPPRIFVSHARSDGREAAADLRRRLEEHPFPLWQDLADMEGGKDWWQQITAAIDHVEYLVLVMTPAALASQVVRREWFASDTKRTREMAHFQKVRLLQLTNEPKVAGL